jgi:small subunit ribosomal protein S8
MDKIANLIISLKNASAVGKEKVLLPYSKLTNDIAELLKKEGYVKAVKVKAKDENPSSKYLEIIVAYDENNQPKVREVARISKSSKRVYAGVKEIAPFRRGKGLRVLTTPKGILTDKEAKKEHVGGEVLFTIF